MVRRAQVPLANRSKLELANAATNLNALPAEDAVDGPRVFPLAHPDILRSLCLTRERLVSLCIAASRIWADAFSKTQMEANADNRPDSPQFGYGSVDFVIREGDHKAVPIEMNGSNVGSHPAVHPKYLDAFGQATTHALHNLGLGDDGI